MNKVEQEAVQGHINKDIESVSINSIQFNKNHSVLTANFKMSAGQSNIMVPYKLDTDSDGNIMPLQMYKKLFASITNEQLATTKNKNVLLNKYNKTTIAQLGTCTVIIEHNNKKKKCRFCVVPGNGQVLLGMPDTDVLSIIKICIDSIGLRMPEIARAVQTCTQPGRLNQSRKYTVLRSAIQIWTAFQNQETIAQSQWMKQNLIKQQNTFYQV